MPKKKHAAVTTSDEINLNLNQQSSAFRLFNIWSCKALGTLQDVQEAIKAFADESRDFYLPMPMALPPNLRAKIEDIMVSDPGKLNPMQLSVKDNIVQRLRYFFKNQAELIKPTNAKSAELWCRASYLLRRIKASAGADSYAEIPFTREAVQGIFAIADEAVEVQSIDHDLKDAESIAASETKRTKSIACKVSQFKSRYKSEGENLAEYVKAYRASLKKTKYFPQGDFAKKLKISADQTLGVVTIGKITHQVSPSAYMVWTILRLVIGSEKKEIPLFKNWASQFTYKNRMLLNYIKSVKNPGETAKGHIVKLKIS